MAAKTIHTERELAVGVETVWQKIGGFDLAWHPQVTGCTLLRTANGTLVRAFEDLHGKTYCEERTYVSDTDRVLSYRLTSGIDGLTDYRARVVVRETVSARTVITWQAEIVANPDRLEAICERTQAIFEAGFDALGSLPKARANRTPKPTSGSRKIIRESLDGAPELSFLKAEAADTNPKTLVLFLHGIGGQASNWAGQLERLGGDFAVAAMDLRGYGKSALGSRSTEIDDYCADMLRLSDAFVAEKLVLVGLSYGSWIATSFAMRHGDRLAGLVLAGGCTGMSEAGAEERKAFHASRRVPLDRGESPSDFASTIIDVISGPKITPEQKKILHSSMASIPSETYRDALNCFCNPPETFDFSRITCPVLLMTGRHDRLAAPDEIRQISLRLLQAATPDAPTRDVRFEVIEDAGHVCNLEAPDAFNAHLERFLRRLPGVARDYKPNPAEKQRDKRQRILKAAHDEFCKSGFDGASMDRLADAAGVSKPTLYQYFGDKEGLFAAVMDVARLHVIAPLVTSNGTLVERLWAFSWTYADFVLRPDMLSLARLILGEASRRPDSAMAYHRSGPQKALTGIASFITDAVAAGEMVVDDATLAANDLWSLILSGPRDHFLHHVNETPDPVDLLDSIGHGLRVFLTVYSTHRDRDLAELQVKLDEAQARRLTGPKQKR